MKHRLTPVARLLRQGQTPTEVKLWAVLRRKGLHGIKFHRQYVIGGYVVDFCSRSKKLVIEIDGGYHSEPMQKEKDRIRDFHLELMGYKILRIWANEVNENLDGVAEKILETLLPLPKGENARS